MTLETRKVTLLSVDVTLFSLERPSHRRRWAFISRLAQLLDGLVIRLLRGIELVSERVRTVWLELSVSRVWWRRPHAIRVNPHRCESQSLEIFIILVNDRRFGASERTKKNVASANSVRAALNLIRPTCRYVHSVHELVTEYTHNSADKNHFNH